MKVSVFFVFLLLFFVFTTILMTWLFWDRQQKLKWLLKRLQKLRSLTDVATKEIDYKILPVSEKAENQLIDKLKKALEEDKVYLDSALTIESLSRQLGTNKSSLSKVINESLDRNFPTLLNDYRVKYALQLFNDPKYSNYTIEAIAEMSGYNSRQVFHKAFKSRVGVPPRRFRN